MYRKTKILIQKERLFLRIFRKYFDTVISYRKSLIFARTIFREETSQHGVLTQNRWHVRLSKPSFEC